MNIEIDEKDVDLLIHSSNGSFAQDQPSRFEYYTYKGVKFEDCHDNGSMHYVDSYLDALIVFQWYSNEKNLKASIMCDVYINDKDEFCSKWLVWTEEDLRKKMKEKYN